jgi:hypothetical protein
MQFVGLIVHLDPEEDFSALSMYLELTYGPLVRMLPSMWSFKSDRDVVDILTDAEDFLFGHSAICIRFDQMMGITDDMAERYA